jgi:hypothetical protein
MATKEKIKWYAAGPNEILGYDPQGSVINSDAAGRFRLYSLTVTTLSSGAMLWTVYRKVAHDEGHIQHVTVAQGRIACERQAEQKAARKQAQALAEVAYRAHLEGK